MGAVRPIVRRVGSTQRISIRRLERRMIRVRTEGTLLLDWCPSRSRIENRDSAVRPHRSTNGQPSRARCHKAREGLRIPIIDGLVAQDGIARVITGIITGIRVAIPSELQDRRQLPARDLRKASLATIRRGNTTSRKPFGPSQARKRCRNCEGE